MHWNTFNKKFLIITAFLSTDFYFLETARTRTHARASTICQKLTFKIGVKFRFGYLPSIIWVSSVIWFVASIPAARQKLFYIIFYSYQIFYFYLIEYKYISYLIRNLYSIRYKLFYLSADCDRVYEVSRDYVEVNRLFV